MRTTRLFLIGPLAVSSILFSSFALCAEPSPGALMAPDIVQKARVKQFPENSVSDLTMVLINKRGQERVRKLLTKRKDYGDGEAKSVAYFLSPSDV